MLRREKVENEISFIFDEFYGEVEFYYVGVKRGGDYF